MKHITLRVNHDIYDYIDSESIKAGVPISVLMREYLELAVAIDKIRKGKNLPNKNDILAELKEPNLVEQGRMLAQYETLHLLRQLVEKTLDEPKEVREFAANKAMNNLKKALGIV